VTTHHRNSKADTRGLFIDAGAGATDLLIDRSQWRTNLTNHTTWLTSTDTRLAVRSPREIGLVINASAATSGIVVNWGNTAGTGWIYRVEVDGATGLVRFHHNSAENLTTLTLPNLDKAEARQYVVHWSTEYDEFAAGYYSEMLVHDVTSGTYVHTRVTNTQPSAPVGGDQFNLSGYNTGTNGFPLASIVSARVSCRFHSTTEAAEDWVDESATPSVAGVQPAVELAPVSPNEYADYEASDPVNHLLLTSGNAGLNPSFAGPAELLAVMHAGEHRRRCYSPLINLALRSPPTLQDTYLPANMHRELETVGTPRVLLGHYWVRPVPFGASTARVRVFVQTWLAAGAPMGSAISVQLVMRVRSNLLTAEGPTPGPISSVVIVTTNHGSTGLGEWVDLGTITWTAPPLKRVFFYLSHRFGSGTGAAYQRAKIKHVLVEPYEE
jgi:hypothetical protein